MSTQKPEVTTIFRSQYGGSRAKLAHQLMTERATASQAASRAEHQLLVLDRLSETPPRKNVFKRLRQRRRLKTWLERKGYRSPTMARTKNIRALDNASVEHQRVQESLEEVWLPECRKTLKQLSPAMRQKANVLFVKFGIPDELVKACQAQASASGREADLVEWFGNDATDKELEELLLWNADNTERLASDPEKTHGLVDNYLKMIESSVYHDELDASWATAIPHINRIIIGDVLDERMLGYGDTERYGAYSDDGDLTLWPYELGPDDGSKHIVEHEVTHSLGGVATSWLNEGLTEIFSLTVAGEDPQKKTGLYELERHGIKRMCDKAPRPISYKDLSAFYVGEDVETNDEQLREFVTNIYGGYDIIATAQNAFDEILGDEINRLYPDKEYVARSCAIATLIIAVDFYADLKVDAPQTIKDLKEYEALSTDPAHKIAYRHVIDLYEERP